MLAWEFGQILNVLSSEVVICDTNVKFPDFCCCRNWKEGITLILWLDQRWLTCLAGDQFLCHSAQCLSVITVTLDHYLFGKTHTIIWKELTQLAQLMQFAGTLCNLTQLTQLVRACSWMEKKMSDIVLDDFLHLVAWRHNSISNVTDICDFHNWFLNWIFALQGKQLTLW